MDFYFLQKKKNPNYSYKSFSKSAGISSPNYLSLVMDGSRNLTTTSIQQFAEALNLRPDELEYFETLVHYNQSKRPAEEKYYKKRLNLLKKSKPLTIQKASPISALKEWYSTGILVLAHGRDLEAAILKCKSELAINRDVVEENLQKMIDIGYLELLEGRFYLSSQQITFHDAKSFVHAQEIYLQAQIDQSKKAFLYGYRRKKGKFLSHTLTVPKSSAEEIHKEFVAMMENLTLKMDEQVVIGEEELCQINVQIFQPNFSGSFKK
jgi:uncharacterized protein (TIGR02147 family)